MGFFVKSEFWNIFEKKKLVLTVTTHSTQHVKATNCKTGKILTKKLFLLKY